MTGAPRPAVESRSGADGVQRAIGEAERLLVAAEAHAVMLAELGAIELPPAARAEPVQLRAIASLYLASTLEAAGLIEAADDLARLTRSGALAGDLGDAAPLVAEFWNDRNSRTTADERGALFARLFGSPAGAVDVAGSVNDAFEEMLLELCDAIIDAADHGSERRVRAAGMRLAENVAGVANDVVLLMAREIIDSISQAIAILNHPQLRALLSARSLWDAVAAIDRRFRRRSRPTLSYLRRGRAGMTVLAWLADAQDTSHADEGPLVRPSDSVLDAAIDWVDETLSIIRAQEDSGASDASTASSGHPDSRSGESAWLDFAR
jgi:hypothetical protein